MAQVDISVIILTYNSDYGKTISTINSILNQKNCSLEIIVADDGSKENNFSCLDSYFSSCDFHNYQLIGDGINRGTVSNLYKAVQKSNGDCIKPISPGDYLFDETTLFNMMTVLKSNESAACFGKAIYYMVQHNAFLFTPYSHNPYFIKPYIQQNIKKIRANYLVFRDPILGASLMYDKKALVNELSIINNHVRYCEDSVLNLMVAKSNSIVFLNKNVIFYESNTGISSKKKSKWTKFIYNDNHFVFDYLTQNNLLTISEFKKSFSNNRLIRFFLTVRFCFFKFLCRKIDRRHKIVKKMPIVLVNQIEYISAFSNTKNDFLKNRGKMIEIQID